VNNLPHAMQALYTHAINEIVYSIKEMEDDMETMKDHLDQFKRAAGTMAKTMPSLWSAWNQFGQAAMAEGVLPKRTKELVAIGIAIHSRCTYCIGLHVRSAMRLGISREEIMEVAGVAMLMGGGPSMTYLTEVLAAIEMVEQDTADG
jgi:AhpD family alkylhydroperoxidase